MKNFLLILLFSALAATAGAQGIERQRARLATPEPVGRARVEVKQEAVAARAIAAADSVRQDKTVTGYCVNLFGGNSQSAGENARSVAAQFRELFPNIQVRVEYQSPYFNVMAGCFLDKMDAIVLCGKALKNFPKAVVMQDEIPVADIAGQLKSTSEEILEQPLVD